MALPDILSLLWWDSYQMCKSNHVISNLSYNYFLWLKETPDSYLAFEPLMMWPQPTLQPPVCTLLYGIYNHMNKNALGFIKNIVDSPLSYVNDILLD